MTTYHRLLLLIICYSCIVYGQSSLSDRFHFSIQSKGYFSGQISTSGIPSLENNTNNHGSIFGAVGILAGLDSINCIKSSFELSSPNFSETDSFYLKPRMQLRIGKKWNKKPLQWSMNLGGLDRTTVGYGLTIKDFRQIGASGNFSANNLTLSFMFFGQGYKVDEDMLVLGGDYSKDHFSAGLNTILWRIQGASQYSSFSYWDQYYISTYILPSFSVTLPKFQFYLEPGFKIISERYTSSYFPQSEDFSYAFLSGIKYTDILFKTKISINPEIRFYSKGFIPVTGVDTRHLSSLEQKWFSQNNWIDFFDSREQSFWYYHSIEVESPSYRNFSVFAKNELLYFNSKQDTLVRTYEGEKIILSYHPSTSYYWVGLKYTVSFFTTIKFMISNHMLNRNYDEIYDYEEYGHQYMRRFYAARDPLLELLVDWCF